MECSVSYGGNRIPIKFFNSIVWSILVLFLIADLALGWEIGSAIETKKSDKRNGKFYALVIGVSSYPLSKSNYVLKSGLAAIKIRETLFKFAQKRRYSEEDIQIQLMIDESPAEIDRIRSELGIPLTSFQKYLPNQKPIGLNIFTKLNTFIRKMEDNSPENTIVFYFHGHGKNNVLIPSGQSGFNENLNIKLLEIKREIEKAKSASRIIIIDACRFKSEPGGSTDPLAWVKLGQPEEGTIFYLGNAEGKPSFVDEDLGYGYFSSSLMEGLVGGADGWTEKGPNLKDDDGKLYADELKYYLKYKVNSDLKGDIPKRRYPKETKQEPEMFIPPSNDRLLLYPSIIQACYNKDLNRKIYDKNLDAAIKHDRDLMNKSYEIEKNIGRYLPYGIPKLNPKNKPRDANEFSLLEQPEYIVGYDKIKMVPVWSSYRFPGKDYKLNTLKNGILRQDPRFESEYSANCNDYEGQSKYALGKLVPELDFAWSDESSAYTFLLTNAVPQHYNFKRKIWLYLENRIRDWARKNEGLYVITGSIFNEDKSGASDWLNNRQERVEVPSHFFKIIVKKKLNNNASEVVAFLLPHVDLIPKNPDDYLRQHIVSIQTLKKKTGIDFFTDIKKNVIEELNIIPWDSNQDEFQEIKNQEFSNFKNSDSFTLNGHASLENGSVRLTPDCQGQAGALFFNQPFLLEENKSFSIHFKFRISTGLKKRDLMVNENETLVKNKLCNDLKITEKRLNEILFEEEACKEDIDDYSAAAKLSYSQKLNLLYPDKKGDDHLSGDGMAFIIQNDWRGRFALGGGSNGLGYGNLAYINSFYGPISPSLIVEFDTYSDNSGDPKRKNGKQCDTDYQHVAVTLNGDMTRYLEGYSLPEFRLDTGEPIFAWIDYHRDKKRINIFLSTNKVKPKKVLRSVKNIDLSSILGSNKAYFGFSAGTGGWSSEHYLDSWSLTLN
jgi:endonuclease G